MKPSSFIAAIVLATASLFSSSAAGKSTTAKVIDINDPIEMHVFLPDSSKATGRMVINFPGGGYTCVAMEHEGTDWSEFFNSLGIAYAVVNYRLPGGDSTIPVKDAWNAFILARKNASDWNINPSDVGIMGFSAGGHLASTVATHSQGDTAPNFQILFYPVISMQKGLTHEWSHDYLVGKDAPPTLNDEFSGEKNVTSSTPKAFIALSGDDTCVNPLNSVYYYIALQKAGVPATLHIYDSGDHGWGLRNSFKYHNQMLYDLKSWLTSF